MEKFNSLGVKHQKNKKGALKIKHNILDKLPDSCFLNLNFRKT